MSESQMKKYNLKWMREVAEGVLVSDITGDEWIIRHDNVLMHRNNRGKYFEFHRQKEVKGFYHAIRYISSHATKHTRKPTRVNRMDYLFSLI